jgi:hypothetical protein
MERGAVVEFFLRELLEVLNGRGCDIAPKLDDHLARVGLDDGDFLGRRFVGGLFILPASAGERERGERADCEEGESEWLHGFQPSARLSAGVTGKNRACLVPPTTRRAERQAEFHQAAPDVIAPETNPNVQSARRAGSFHLPTQNGCATFAPLL